MGTWTLYAAGADVSMLAMLLNGVAMLCQQTAFIWGFAVLAATWQGASTTVRLATTASGSAMGGLPAALLDRKSVV